MNIQNKDRLLVKKKSEGGVMVSRKCTRCQSIKFWKDGKRRTKIGLVQRRVCRDCGYRFTDSSLLSMSTGNNSARQVCATPTGAKNLTKAPPKSGLAGATKDEQSLLFDFAWQMKKRGLADSTIKQRVYRLGVLAS